MLKHFLEKLLDRRDLTADESAELIESLISEPDCYQAGAVLAAMRMKGESVSELVGGAQFLRRHACFIDCGGRDAVDIVGTGGDGGISFNISTASALVAAGAGVCVAKHGNGAVSGKCGSADVLAELGFNLDARPGAMEQCIQTHGIGFLFARKLHPVLGRAAAMRRALGIRTIFNLLGPLANPAGVRRMVAGVYDSSLTELYAEALRELGVKHALVVHGEDGLDEISCCAPTRVAELRDGEIRCYELYPELLLGTVYEPAEIAGGDRVCNAAILRAVLEAREKGAPRAAVLLNAGGACFVAGAAASVREGMALAADSIDSGRALEKLEILMEASRS